MNSLWADILIHIGIWLLAIPFGYAIPAKWPLVIKISAVTGSCLVVGVLAELIVMQFPK